MLGFHKFFQGRQVVIIYSYWQPHENLHLEFHGFFEVEVPIRIGWSGHQDTEAAFFCTRTACLATASARGYLALGTECIP